MKHVVMFSGGAGSWAAAKRVAEQHGTADLTLLFADTLIEDADLYRFLGEAAENIGAPLVQIADGRTPWQVFRDERFLGNARVGLCSKVLKQQQVDGWLDAMRDPVDTIVYVGLDWSEEHRLARLRALRGAAGWDYRAPLCEAPYLTRDDVLAEMRREGLRPPRLYEMGFAHNNCGGGCVRAGVGHFAHLARALPGVFAEWERNEQGLRDFLGRDDIAIPRDRTGGQARPLTLTQLRGRLDAGWQPDLFDIGGCGCFSDVEDAA
jgi:3'-phosphoadenosine 5'-phosphosulfate sulfotransferase (PAPS reductase)/FAD synthetase